MDGLYRVTTSYLCAGFIVRGGRVVETAPILWRLRGKALAQVRYVVEYVGP